MRRVIRAAFAAKNYSSIFTARGFSNVSSIGKSVKSETKTVSVIPRVTTRVKPDSLKKVIKELSLSSAWSDHMFVNDEIAEKAAELQMNLFRSKEGYKILEAVDQYKKGEKDLIHLEVPVDDRNSFCNIVASIAYLAGLENRYLNEEGQGRFRSVSAASGYVSHNLLAHVDGSNPEDSLMLAVLRSQNVSVDTFFFPMSIVKLTDEEKYILSQEIFYNGSYGKPFRIYEPETESFNMYFVSERGFYAERALKILDHDLEISDEGIKKIINDVQNKVYNIGRKYKTNPEGYFAQTGTGDIIMGRDGRVFHGRSKISGEGSRDLLVGMYKPREEKGPVDTWEDSLRKLSKDSDSAISR